jgi:SnoaL-like domain
MTLPLEATGTAETYHQVERFYARQMQLLDDGAVDKWAGTFTEDGVFAANAYPEPVSGRASIASAARSAVAELARKKIVRRHWLGMLTVDPRPDGTIGTRCYALVISTPEGGPSSVQVSTVCEDVLVSEDGDYLVRERRVTRDDIR